MLEKLRTLRQRPRQKAEPAPADNIVWLRPDAFRRNSLAFAVVTDERGFREWHRGVVQALGRDDASYVCELKLNGIGATLMYEDGLLVEVIPHADGPEWRGIARHMRALEGVPSAISRDDVPKRLEVLCEFYSSEGRLQAFAHGIAHTKGGSVPGNSWADLAYLKNLGFKTSPHSRLARAPEDVISFYRMWLAKRDEPGYDCDGIVVKVNRKDYQRDVGYSGSQARWGRYI